MPYEVAYLIFLFDMCSIINKLPDISHRLYMYFRAESAIKFLENHNLKFSNVDLVNDPFECSIDFNSSLSTIGFLAYYPHTTPLIDLQKDWREHSKSLRIACFTTDPASVLMWAYYADGQKGICIEFDPSKDPLFFENHLRQVKYESQMPTIKRYCDDLDYSDILVTKSAQWKHEQEWRVIRDDLRGDFYPINPAAITGIIWGCSTARYYNDTAKSDTHQRLFSLLQRPEYEHIHLQCIVLDGQKYELQCKDMPLFVLMRSSHTVVVVSLKEQHMKIHCLKGNQYVAIYEAFVRKWEQTAISLPNGHYLISNDDESRNANISLDVID